MVKRNTRKSRKSRKSHKNRIKTGGAKEYEPDFETNHKKKLDAIQTKIQTFNGELLALLHISTKTPDIKSIDIAIAKLRDEIRILERERIKVQNELNEYYDETTNIARLATEAHSASRKSKSGL